MKIWPDLGELPRVPSRGERQLSGCIHARPLTGIGRVNPLTRAAAHELDRTAAAFRGRLTSVD